jgi:hypothetical protein
MEILCQGWEPMLSRVLFFRLAAIFVVILTCWSPEMLKAELGRATLAWDPIDEPDLGGYTVLWGQAPKTYTNSQNVLAGTGTELSISLEAGKTYYMAVRGYDKQGVAGELSQEVVAVVKGPVTNQNPNAPIKFLGITLSNVSNTSVTVNWTTDKATTGFVEYGPATSFSYISSEGISTPTHVTSLTGLTASTLYSYRITAIDAQNNRVTYGTLLFKTSDRLSQPAKPSSEAIFIPSVVENERFRTNLGINNLSKTIANVSLTLVDIEGLVLGSKTIQVESEGLNQLNSVARVLFENGGGSDIQGNLYIESDQPISAWASQIDNTTNDPSLLLSKRTGSTKILIPSSANTSTFSSSLVVMNVGYSNAQVVLKAYGTSGKLLGQTATPLNIPPNGVLSLANVLQTLGVIDDYGPLEITSLNNVPLIASSRVSSTLKAGGFFEGLRLSEASTTQTVPHVVDNAEIRTNLGINNVTSFPATVMVRLINRGGVEMGAASVLVPAKGLTQINNVIRQLLYRDDVANMDGYIRLESNQPIYGWASLIDNSTNDPGFAMSKRQGALRLLVQSTTNVGSFKSSLVVVNAGSADAVVDIVSRDVKGAFKGELRGVVIPVRGFFSTANVLESLGVSFSYGPLEIISTNGQPLMATSQVYSTSGTSGFFEGQPLQ